jgi:geranylgeranyl diphosphate synthase type II
MRYAVFAGGKRLRPILVLAGCEAAGGDLEEALGLACAVEMIHTYSLVHDDLPALDDDDLRRGRPTVHRAFDEATAILTGDALLTLAFESALGPRAAASSATARSTRDLATRDRRVEALRTLVAAAGTAGMIGGQVDDLQATRAAIDESLVRSIHERKTGALLRACLVIGGILAGADGPILAKLDAYGADLGLSFQIIDDILDIEGTPQALGKSVGKDAATGKATFPAAIGVERSRTLAAELSRSAVETVRDLGEAARPLAALAEFVVRRKA